MMQNDATTTASSLPAAPWVDWSPATRQARRDAIARRLDLLGHPLRWLLLGLLAAACIGLPLLLSGFVLKLYVYVGIAAIGAIGLNLLSGNAGQVSLGHPFFIGMGAYCAAVFGGDLGWPLPAWLAACALLGAVVGAAVGPFALRLRGNYLVMVTIALVFIGSHIFNNWTAVTGGTAGRAITPSLQLLGWDLGDAVLKDRRFAWFVWPLVALCGLGVVNILRSRPGRALHAIRDRDLTAEVLGIDMARYKVAAFALSSALAAVGGGLYGAYVGFASPAEWTLILSIQYLAMIIVGGVGSVLGSVVGAAVVICLPHATQALVAMLPTTGRLISQSPGDGGWVSVFALNQVLFGVLIVVFLTRAPRGLSAVLGALWQRLEARFPRRSAAASPPPSRRQA
jgi:branched-chain amino acid transport system permease protein